MNAMINMSNFLFEIISKAIRCGFQLGLGKAFKGCFVLAFFIAWMYCKI